MKYLTNDILLLQQLSSLNLVSIERPVISYDSLKRQIVYSYIGKNSLSQEFLIETRIKRFDFYRLEEINVYSPQANLPPPLIITSLGLVTASGSIAGTIVSTTTPSLESTPPPLTSVSLPSWRPQPNNGYSLFTLSVSPLYNVETTLPNTVFLL